MSDSMYFVQYDVYDVIEFYIEFFEEEKSTARLPDGDAVTTNNFSIWKAIRFSLHRQDCEQTGVTKPWCLQPIDCLPSAETGSIAPATAH